MKVRLIAVILLAAIGVGALVSFVASSASSAAKYSSFISKAEKNAKNDIPYVAVENYVEAFKIKCSDEKVYKEYIEQNKKLGDSFYQKAIENYLPSFPESAEAYETTCKYYYDQESYRKVIEIAKEARELNLATDKMKEMYNNCIYRFRYIKSGFDEAHSFLGNYALVKQGDAYGYLTRSGSYSIAPNYTMASDFLGSATAVKKDNECFMINDAGFKIQKPSKPVDEMSFLNNGFVLVGINGKYGYADASLKIPDKLEYDQATNFKTGVAAVRKGNKWSLISSEGKKITDFIFDDVIIDEFNTCINNGVIFAKESGKYYMYDSNGKKISKTAFDNAYPFVGEEPAAVCVGGKWGFADATGKMVIEPKYTEAKSFSCGLGAVSKDGMWGYINKNGEERIALQFEDCRPFVDGIAAVRESEVWGYIILLPYESE